MRAHSASEGSVGYAFFIPASYRDTSSGHLFRRFVIADCSEGGPSP